MPPTPIALPHLWIKPLSYPGWGGWVFNGPLPTRLIDRLTSTFPHLEPRAEGLTLAFTEDDELECALGSLDPKTPDLLFFAIPMKFFHANPERYSLFPAELIQARWPDFPLPELTTLPHHDPLFLLAPPQKGLHPRIFRAPLFPDAAENPFLLPVADWPTPPAAPITEWGHLLLQALALPTGETPLLFPARESAILSLLALLITLALLVFFQPRFFFMLSLAAIPPLGILGLEALFPGKPEESLHPVIAFRLGGEPLTPDFPDLIEGLSHFLPHSPKLRRDPGIIES